VTLTPGAGGSFSANIVPAPGEAPRWYVIRSRRAGAWGVEVVSAWARVFGDIDAMEGPPVDLVVVTPVDRLGIEGRSAYVRPGTRQ
jgi:hypothetical protein